MQRFVIVVAVCILSIGLGPDAGRLEAAKPARSRTGKAARAADIRSVDVAPGIVACQYGHFWVITDMKVDEAKQLVQRLETMLGLISGYWGKNPGNVVIPCVVFKQMSDWPPQVISKLHADGVASVREGGGLTVSQNLYLGDVAVQASSVVYAPAAHGTPQHEAVHAFCNLAFATTGPTWYSEGMAELGTYWNEGDSSVRADPRIIAYLRQTTPKKDLKEVLAPFQDTGDSWQNYAWRWALCHLLVNNPNYSAAFRKLGLKMLDKGRLHYPKATREQLWVQDFQEVFGQTTREIDFEYRFFLDHLATGLRADLCAWDWNSKFQGISGPTIKRTMVKANRGWQSAGLMLKGDVEYQYVTSGTWKMAKGAEPLTANGDDDAKSGRLQGVVMKNYRLGEPFDLGERGSFTVPADGNLYLRCGGSWVDLADRSGSISVKFRVKPKAAAKPDAEEKQ